jgi:hypothetical protein
MSLVFSCTNATLSGNIVGELVEGDAKKLWKSGSTCDAEGKFWDNKGNVIGRAETVAREDKEDEAQFAGLEGLVVVADGWVEDENGNRVGKVVEGDPKKLVGRSVDEDGMSCLKQTLLVMYADSHLQVTSSISAAMLWAMPSGTKSPKPSLRKRLPLLISLR